MLNTLLYRSFDFDPNIPLQLNNTTQVIDIPLVIPDIKISKEEARENIATVIGKKLEPADKVIILAGESDDGSFKRRAQEVFVFAKQHPDAHVIMPLKLDDERIAGLDIPENTHAIGFRKDWHELIPGGDITFIRGSWGEIIDLVVSETIPVITSPSTVPMDVDLDTTQFLTQVSEERACNVSLLIKALQLRGIKAETINRLLVDLGNPTDEYTLQEAIGYALQPDVANKIRAALSSIPRGSTGWVEKLHEQLLDQKKPFSTRELARLQKSIWSQARTG